MDSTVHPDDERLAALAGRDPEVLADRTLADHVERCDRCGPIVQDLARLRAALSELPDVAPSRPLQLIPPVPEPTIRRGESWVRRLVAPMVATGAGLLLVGAIGSAGLLDHVAFFASSAAAPREFSGATDSARPPGTAGGPVAAPTASVNGAAGEDTSGKGVDSGGEALTTRQLPMPWVVLLLLGAGLVAGGVTLRNAIQPRAG